MLSASAFTFGKYKIDKKRSTITFTYRADFKFGLSKTYTDKLIFENIDEEAWDKIPEDVLKPTLEALLIMLGINYWCVFPTKNIKIEGFTLTHEQASFWDTLYLKGLGEFFFLMQMDFRDLIAFPYADQATAKKPGNFPRSNRSLLLNGAGKDSILSAETLKESGIPFDFFAFAPTPAHAKIAELVGAKTIRVTRARDPYLDFLMSMFGVSGAYPSVSTFTFIAVLLAELLDYNAIVFSNERSADIGNLEYLGLDVNHQWCKSSEAEKITNDYIQNFITPDIATSSLLRKYSEIEIVKRFVKYPKYLHYVTSCNNYFWLPRPMQIMSRRGYWCKRCPKCVFLFACFTAFLPKQEVIDIFGANLYTHKKLLPLFRRILGLEGFKPLDCVGEPGEMILAMRYASLRDDYNGDLAMEVFKENFSADYDFKSIEEKFLEKEN